MKLVRNQLDTASAIALAALLVGCAVDEVKEDAGNTDASGTTSPLIVKVWQGSDSNNSGVPAAGAAVALDKPDGERIEATTDELGEARFTEYSWDGSGTATVTVCLVGYAVSTEAGLELSDLQQAADEGEALEHGLVAIEADPLVEIGGVALNMLDTQHYMTISTSILGGYHQARGPSWSLTVEPNLPFSIVGLEWGSAPDSTVGPRGYNNVYYAWSLVEHEGISAETSTDIDMSQTATPQTYSGTIPIPSDGTTDFFSTAGAWGQVGAFDSGMSAYLGGVTLIDISADDSAIEYEGEYVTVQSLERPYVHFGLTTATHGSYILAAGYPDTADLALDFIEPPTVVSPSDGNAAPMNAVIEWDYHDSDVSDPNVQMILGITDSLGRYRWFAYLPSGTKTFTLPDLPTGIDPITVVGAGTLNGYIQLYETAEDGDFMQRYAFGAYFSLTN